MRGNPGLLFISLFSFGLAACGGDTNNGDSGTSDDTGTTTDTVPSLAGTWVGEMDCSDPNGWMELDVDVVLEDLGDAEFFGSFEGDGNMVLDGESASVRIEAQLELELTDDAGGPQDVIALWSDCKFWIADDYEENEDCGGYGDNWSWDGEDELSWSNSDSYCTTTASR